MDDCDKMEVAECASPSNPLIRIIGVGDDAWKAIEGVSISYDSYTKIPSASIEKLADSSFRFYDGTRVFIIVTDRISRRLKGVIEEVKDRGILTIVLTAISPYSPIKCDAIGVMSSSRFRQCVEAVLEEFLVDSYFCLDINDIEDGFRDSGSLSFYEKTGDDPEQIMAALYQQMDFNGVTSALMNIALSSASTSGSRVSMRAFSNFADYLEKVDNMLWGIRYDERLDPQIFRVSIFTFRKTEDKKCDHDQKQSFMCLLRKKLEEIF